ncbi:protein FAM, partial [Clarias magur]
MSDSADANCAEAEPLKGQHEEEETDRSSGCGCTGKTGVAKLSGWRTAMLLLSLFICLSVVFAFSFILPCPTELVFFSGKTGEVIGSSKDVGVAPGQVRSHMQFSTSSKAQYILLHTDRGLYAMSLAWLVIRANLTSNLEEDKSWKQRANEQGLITLYNSSSDPLQSVLRVRGGYSSSSRSLLLHTQSTVMLFDTNKLGVTWTSNASNLISTPSFGNFNTDEDPDVVLEEDQGNNTKRVVILDGQTGGVLWKVIMPFNSDDPQPATILTLNSFSVFMLWGESHTHDNHTSLEGEQHSSYLLHPLHETVLLERRNSAQNIITFQ